MSNKSNAGLTYLARFVLFVSSYLPLFILLISQQLYQNKEFLNYGGISLETLICWLSNFGLSCILLLVSVIGYVGYRYTFQNLKSNAPNGDPATIIDIKNKNSEAIGYIGTYILPFLFQDLNNPVQSFSILFLLFIIYRIYINSSLMLINPVLSMKYTLYEVTYAENEKNNKTALILSENDDMQEEDQIQITQLGHKLFFAIDL
ncbi:MAG: hypothetical protein CMP48_18925 [Rickettsiales bacterium]|nr:hypothetical protein [Rickettsiales bacterium]